jgi:thiamine pyrophosphokinase
LFVGDGDSAQPPENLPKILYPRDKDKTDLELAIELCSACSPEKMAVFGALGRRTDHALYNLSLLTRYPGALCFQSEGETLFAIEGRTRLDSPVGSTLSLIPLHNPAEGVTTHGLKWELCDARLDAQFMSVSNEVLASPVEIVVSHGLLLCCIT